MMVRSVKTVLNISCAAFFAALFSSITHGCITDTGAGAEGGWGRGGGGGGGDDPAHGEAVVFPTTISRTRAFDNMWEWGDNIGVYMIPAAGSTGVCDWDDVELYAENRRYVHDLKEGAQPDDEVVFSGADKENTIMWPADKRELDVVAYYPWTPAIADGYLYPVDLSEQTPQKSIDLMWSNNVRGESAGAPALGFGHMLAKIVLNVTDLGGASLAGMTSTFDGLPTRASFGLADGKMVDRSEGGFEPFAGHRGPTSDGDDDGVAEKAVVEAIVLPGERPEGYSVTFALAGGGEAVFVVTAPVYEAGKRYIYNIRLTPPATTDAKFGVDGELKQISQWEEGDTGSYNGDIHRTGGEPSVAWGPVALNPLPAGVTKEGDAVGTGSSLRLPGGAEMTISKEGCEGIVSVTVTVTTAAAGTTIGPMKVGTEELVTDHDRDSSTPPVESMVLPVVAEQTGFTFRTGDGKPRSGELSIAIRSGSGLTSVLTLATNVDVAEKNQ